MQVALVIAVVSLMVASAALAWVVALSRRLRAVVSARGELSQMAGAGDFVGVAQALEDRLADVARDIDMLRADDAAIADRLGYAVRHLGIVRFDALPGDVGENSFAAALLDDHANGFVLTSMYGRGAYRLYAKPIAGGTAELVLTDEETAACARALEGTGLTVSTGGRGRRVGSR